MPRWLHLASCPDGFEGFADVMFVVGGQSLPAHSQYLASHSKLMQSLMRASPSFNKEQPLILDQQLQAFSQGDLQIFLNHVYLNAGVASSAEADALLKVADFFDAAKLMEKSVAYLQEASGEDIFATNEDTMRWLLLAEQFKLPGFLTMCANQAAINFKQVRDDPRFGQLGVAALNSVLRGVHLLTNVYPGVLTTTQALSSYTLYPVNLSGQVLQRLQ